MNSIQETLRAVAAEYKRRGIKDPCRGRIGDPTRHIYSYPATPPGWQPAGDPQFSDTATTALRRAMGGEGE